MAKCFDRTIMLTIYINVYIHTHIYIRIRQTRLWAQGFERFLGEFNQFLLRRLCVRGGSHKTMIHFSFLFWKNISLNNKLQFIFFLHFKSFFTVRSKNWFFSKKVREKEHSTILLIEFNIILLKIYHHTAKKTFCNDDESLQNIFLSWKLEAKCDKFLKGIPKNLF